MKSNTTHTLILTEVFNILRNMLPLPFNACLNTRNTRLYLELANVGQFGTALGQFFVVDNKLNYINYDKYTNVVTRGILIDLADPSINWELTIAEYLKKEYQIDLPWNIAKQYLKE